MKRKIASAMCLVMMGVNMAMPVYAASTATGTGSGSTTYVSTDHYEVIVPTSAALNFKLDPQGLLSLDTNEKKSVDDLKDTSTAGAIYGSNALVFANLGTDEVSVSASFGVTGNATALAHDGTVVADPSSSDPALNIKLALVPVAAERDTDVTYKMDDSTVNAGLFKATTTAFKSGDEVKGVAFDNTNSTFSFKLAAPSWNITKLAEDSYTLEMDQDTNDKAVAFKIGGECNSKADWSDFVGANPSKSVGLTATFTLDKAADNFTPDVTLDLDAKTVATTAKHLIKVPVENTAPAAPTAIDDENITVSGKEITIAGFTGTASDVSVKIDGEDATASTDYTAVTSTDDELKVTLAGDSGEDRAVAVTFKVGSTTYTASATVKAAYSTVEDVTLPTSGNALEIPVSIGSLGGVPTKLNGINMYGDNKTYELIGTEGSWGATYDSSNTKIILGADVAAWMIENAETTKAATFEVEFDKGEKASFAFK